MIKVSIQRPNWIHLLPRFWCCPLAKGPGGDLHTFGAFSVAKFGWTSYSFQRGWSTHTTELPMYRIHIFFKETLMDFLKEEHVSGLILKWKRGSQRDSGTSATEAVRCSEHLLGRIPPQRGRAFANHSNCIYKWPGTLWSLVQSIFKNVNVFDNFDGHLLLPHTRNHYQWEKNES